MQSVTCRVASGALAGHMEDMRQWLDHHRCEIENFEHYRMTGDIIVIQINFLKLPDAVEFAAEFNGEMALYG